MFFDVGLAMKRPRSYSHLFKLDSIMRSLLYWIASFDGHIKI